MQDKVLTVEEVAERLRYSPKTIYRLFQAGHLLGYTAANRGGVRIFETSVKGFVRAFSNEKKKGKKKLSRAIPEPVDPDLELPPPENWRPS